MILILQRMFYLLSYKWMKRPDSKQIHKGSLDICYHFQVILCSVTHNAALISLDLLLECFFCNSCTRKLFLINWWYHIFFLLWPRNLVLFLLFLPMHLYLAYLFSRKYVPIRSKVVHLIDLNSRVYSVPLQSSTLFATYVVVEKQMILK